MLKLTAIGIMAAPPETLTTKSGKPYVRFSVGVNYFQGEEKKVEWLSCTAFGRTAEYVQNYCDKGDKIWFDGSEPHTITYTSKKDGQVKAGIQVIVERVEKCGGQRPATDGQGWGGHTTATATAQTTTQNMKEDVPF